MSYLTAVPLSLSNPRFEEYFPEFVRRCKAAGVGRIFLCPAMPIANEAAQQDSLNKLKKYVPLLHAEGFEVGSWNSVLGHGGTCGSDLASNNVMSSIGLMRSLNGVQDGENFCPLDETLQQVFGEWVKKLAATGVDIIQLDDDYRMGYRAGERFCCCDKHVAVIEERTGEKFDAGRMKKALTEGGPNKWRDAWLYAQGYGLTVFAQKMREAVNEVNPNVRLTACSCLSVWDVDGVDSLTLAKAFAGDTHPIVRLIGAPYWAALRNFQNTNLATVCEYERMQQHWAEGSGVEIFCEGDVYPRPRYIVPAAYLEGFDQVMQAAGTSDGILKYMFDYTSSPTYETGYYDRHMRNRNLYRTINKAFAGKKATGITVFEPMNTLAFSHEPGDLEDRCIPASLRFVTDNSLPVRYDAGDGPTVIFGDAAERAGKEQLANGAILDAAAARILKRRGFDVGLVSGEEFFAAAEEHFPAYNEVVSVMGGRWRRFEPAAGAAVLSRIVRYELDGTMDAAPGAYRYENAAGQRFLVYAFDAAYSIQTVNTRAITRGWCRAAQLRSQLAWLSGSAPAAVCEPAPDLYTLVKQDENSLTVGVWNFGTDEVFCPQVRLGGEWDTVTAHAGTALLNGRIVTLSELPSFGFACFTVRKKA
ncbi:MAG: hypothetical protein IJ412_06675 [Oscillospiraceae bacterium]|nr:hypothetical protein [Oscillospiraceae bacterium]